MNDDLEALVAAFYAAFDNRDGRAPAGDALRALFTEDATIMRVADGQSDSWDAEGFVSPRIALLTGGALADFHEWETDSRTLVLEHIASRWSTYEKEGVLDGADYRGGGHKLLHFRRVAGEWRIASLLWEDR